MQIDADDADAMRRMTDWLRDKLGSSVVVVGAVIGERPQLVAAVTNDLTARGVHADNLVKSIAPLIGGRGGGAPHMAQAGGKDAASLLDALQLRARLGRRESSLNWTECRLTSVPAYRRFQRCHARIPDRSA